MAHWKPRLAAGVDLRALNLTPEQGFLLSRLDGNTTVTELAALTHASEADVRASLEHLTALGAVAPPSADMPQQKIAQPDGALAESPPHEPACDSQPLEESAIDDGLNHRRLFETELHPLPEDERARLAQSCGEPHLSALCFDPLPSVVKRVLESSHAGLSHARLIAAHHQNPVGLEALAHRAELFRDGQVQRLLMRNPQLPESLLKRIGQPKRMLDVYKLAISREVPEKNRHGALRLLRSKFATGAAEERVELIFHTEGRALASLAGIAIDGKTTALLCQRPYHSTMLIQNIARWASAPPALIAHLLKQPVVKRQPSLRQALLRHPNAPSSAER